MSLRSQAPTARLPAPPLGQLHGERAISMVSTFQLTRSTRLNLTHPTEAELACPPSPSPPSEAKPGCDAMSLIEATPTAAPSEAKPSADVAIAVEAPSITAPSEA